jgi:O-methyltransferase
MKNTIRKILASLGYEIRRTNGRSVPFENFANLAQAYEHHLNSDGALISYNEMRTKLLARLMGTPPSEAYFIVDALAKCKNLQGDVCEFGVAQGETSALIANEIIQSTKRLHLFDSFKGLPRPSDKDRLKDDIFALGSMKAYTGTMSNPESMVRGRLNAIAFPAQRYVIHKGFIEQLIHEDNFLPDAVCFAYVDFDFYEPIKIALNFLHNVTPVGSIIIVDDYDAFSTGAKTAVDEFVQSRMPIGTVYECEIPSSNYGHFAILTKRAREGS